MRLPIRSLRLTLLVWHALSSFRTVGLLLGPTLLAIEHALLQDWAREPGPQPVR